ncbi:MAG: hypothetical protein ACRECD_01730, partial [Burkholderiaceae bacterium]
RQACERQAREMQRQAVAAAVAATFAAVVKISTAVTHGLVATVCLFLRQFFGVDAAAIVRAALHALKA